MEDIEDTSRPILQPRREGEDIKKAEAVLRRRNDRSAHVAERKRQAAAAEKERKRQQSSKVIPPQRFVRMTKNKLWDRRRLKTSAKNPMAKGTMRANILLAVRNNRVCPSEKTLNALTRSGLKKFNSAVLLPNDEPSHDLIRMIGSHVYYGYPSLESVRSLFLKRAELRNNRKKVPVTDNVIIEEKLGHLGMLCLEDVVDHLWQGGDKSRQILACFEPFQLNDLKKEEGLEAKKIEYGNIRGKINQKLDKILG